MEVKEEYKTIFSEESHDQLGEWEEALLTLEKTPNDTEQINRMFRAIHTLKGSAGFIGYDELQKVAHNLESSLGEARDSKQPPSQALLDILFQGLDLCKSMVESFSQGTPLSIDISGFIARVEAARAGASPSAKPEPPVAVPVQSPAQGTAVSNPQAAVPSSPAPAKPSGQAGAPSGAAGGAAVRLEIRVDAQGREAFLRSCIVKSRLEKLGRIAASDPEPESLKDSSGKFIYTVTLETDKTAESIVAGLSIDQVTVSALTKSAEPPAGQAAPAAAAGQEAGPSEAAQANHTGKAEEVVRVSVEKLDSLLNLVGELVIQNSGFAATTQMMRERFGRDAFFLDLEEKTQGLSKITRDLQDGIMKARMLPVATAFNRFHRVVRDLAKSGSKGVNLDIFGEETEIDKKVIDRIGEPLVHLIRNAVDHGLEPEAERMALGKSAVGTIRLGAYQDGDHICIEVSDDGRGLDHTAILKKAVEKGLITSDAAQTVSVDQILGFIFLPGFSTAKQVSNISGRGVGMDVVKRAVDDMGGNVRIKSAVHKGTTVTISLPLTMAIISAVLVEIGDATFAIPLTAVREILKTDLSDVDSVGNRRVIRLREEVLPLVHLGHALHGMIREAQKAALTTGMPVVIVDFEGRKIGLAVEKVIGTREIVIKSLSRHYKEIEGLIGASILGNGKIALIIDVGALISTHGRGSDGGGKAAGKTATIQFDGQSLAAQPAQQGPASPSEPGATSAQRAESPAPAPQPAPVQPAPTQKTDTPPAAAAPLSPLPAAAAPSLSTAAPTAVGGVAVAERSPEADIAEQARVEVEAAQKMMHNQAAVLEEMNNNGAIQASMAVSQLLGREIRVSFPESRLIDIREVADAMGGEELAVGGIYVGVIGELESGILLVIPAENLFRINDYMNRQPLGTTEEISQIDTSALSEFGNILAASFVNSMANTTHLALSPEVPEIAIDLCLTVIDSVMARFNQPGNLILLTQAVIFWDEIDNMVCNLLLFIEPESLKRLANAMAKGAAGGTG